MNSSFEENFNLNHLDFSPSFYSNNNNKSSTNKLFEFNKNSESIDSCKNYLHENSFNLEDDFKMYRNKNNSYDNTLSLPNRHHKSMKKAASYYNEYYRDISNKNKFHAKNTVHNENEKSTAFEKINAKYIDDEDDASFIMNDSNDEKIEWPMLFRKVIIVENQINEVEEENLTSEKQIYTAKK